MKKLIKEIERLFPKEFQKLLDVGVDNDGEPIELTTDEVEEFLFEGVSENLTNALNERIIEDRESAEMNLDYERRQRLIDSGY